MQSSIAASSRFPLSPAPSNLYLSFSWLYFHTPNLLPPTVTMSDSVSGLLASSLNCLWLWQSPKLENTPFSSGSLQAPSVVNTHSPPSRWEARSPLWEVRRFLMSHLCSCCILEGYPEGCYPEPREIERSKWKAAALAILLPSGTFPDLLREN